VLNAEAENELLELILELQTHVLRLQRNSVSSTSSRIAAGNQLPPPIGIRSSYLQEAQPIKGYSISIERVFDHSHTQPHDESTGSNCWNRLWHDL
jgi:hypothetical protein